LTQRAAHRNTQAAPDALGVGSEFCLIISD
jgi:hypothetical protein